MHKQATPPQFDYQSLIKSHKCLFSKHFDNAKRWLLEQNCYAYSADLTYIRRFWLKNFNKRPIVIPKYIIPNLNAIIKSIGAGNGISVVSDFLAKDFIDEKKQL